MSKVFIKTQNRRYTFVKYLPVQLLVLTDVLKTEIISRHKTGNNFSRLFAMKDNALELSKERAFYKLFSHSISLIPK